MKFNSIYGAVLVLVTASPVSAQSVQSAGKVLIVAGIASVQRAGNQLPLSSGFAIENGDTLSVGDKSSLQVRFTDESVVALRANSQFKIENYRFDKNTDTDRSFMGLVKGGMRTVTGLIGKANNKNYLIQTSTATIGIRGTHFTVVTCNNDCTRADGAPEANGTYGSVTDGRISVANTSGAVEFIQQESFYVPSQATLPVRLLAPPVVLADRGAVSRGRAVVSTGGDNISIDSRHSGTNESTSPQLLMQRSPAVETNAPLATFSSFRQPMLSPSEVSPQSPNEIATVRFSGFMTPAGFSTNAQTTNNFTVADAVAVANEPDLANAVVTDAASAATAIRRFKTVNSFNNSGSLVYYYYVAPTGANDLGVHRAFGNGPVGVAPTFGIAQYDFVGSTTPTDNYGRSGVFSNTNLIMNFGGQTIQTQGVTTIAFLPNVAMNITTQYRVPGQTFSMNTGVQALTGVTCSNGSGCSGVSTGTVNGQFLGANRDYFAASILVRNTQLTTANTANAGGNISIYNKQ